MAPIITIKWRIFERSCIKLDSEINNPQMTKKHKFALYKLHVGCPMARTVRQCPLNGGSGLERSPVVLVLRREVV